MNEYSLSKPKFYLKYTDDILADDYSKIEFTRKKQVNHSILCLGGFISDIDNKNLSLQIYQKWSNTELIKNIQNYR